MKTKSILFGLLVSAHLSWPGGVAASNRTDRLIIHEWGTFTVLQDENGRSVPGVNINEESLPNFVHRLADGLAPDSPELGPLLSTGPYANRFLRSKGIPRFYPAVTMRMETPIIYFYPPTNSSSPLNLDVEVQFRAGWISEWFPHAYNDAPGFHPGPNETFAGKLNSDTLGRIRWTGLEVGGEGGVMPPTQEHVWLAPRQVPAAAVRNKEGETERYLFYRGVANLEAPLQVVRQADHRLEVTPNQRALTMCASQDQLTVRSLWLADIRPDGRTAFRTVPSIDLRKGKGKTIPAAFTDKDYRSRTELRASMRQAIIADGLFEPEADALLNTWEASYFKTPGLRLFFLTPRAWTEAVLPLTVSQSADINRVMIGRIELVTPEQRTLLTKISNSSSDSSWFAEPFGRLSDLDQGVARGELLAGRKSLEDYGIRMPDNYRAYLALGRFRDALVLEAANREKSAGLHAFAETYGLRYFKSTL